MYQFPFCVTYLAYMCIRIYILNLHTYKTCNIYVCYHFTQFVLMSTCISLAHISRYPYHTNCGIFLFWYFPHSLLSFLVVPPHIYSVVNNNKSRNFIKSYHSWFLKKTLFLYILYTDINNVRCKGVLLSSRITFNVSYVTYVFILKLILKIVTL